MLLRYHGGTPLPIEMLWHLAQSESLTSALKHILSQHPPPPQRKPCSVNDLITVGHWLVRAVSGVG